MGQDHIEWVFDDAKSTIISRGEERDQPDGERTIPRCVTAFNSITGHKLSNEDGWLFMQVLKLCRSVQGAYKYDDYRDGLGYSALRAEEARMTEEARLAAPKPNEALRNAAEKYKTAVACGDLQVMDAVSPGMVIEVCNHKRSNCYECDLHNDVDIRANANGVFVPVECDNRGGA